jgi:hypothetical protein
MHGLKDWHALEESIKSGLEPGPFDSDLAEDQLHQRLQGQLEIIAKDLAEIDLNGDFSRQEESVKKTMSDAEFAAYSSGSRNRAATDLMLANKRWRQHYSYAAIASLTPTFETTAEMHRLLDRLGSDEVNSLPQKLALWWRKNIPHQAVVSEALDSITLDSTDLLSVMRFASYWGELCVHYAETINWTMAMGTADILATQYGLLHAVYNGPTQEELEKDYEKVLAEAMDLGARVFLDGYPRADFLPVYVSQPEAFALAGDEVWKILESPSSTEGVWSENDRRHFI